VIGSEGGKEVGEGNARGEMDAEVVEDGRVEGVKVGRGGFNGSVLRDSEFEAPQRRAGSENGRRVDRDVVCCESENALSDLREEGFDFSGSGGDMRQTKFAQSRRFFVQAARRISDVERRGEVKLAVELEVGEGREAGRKFGRDRDEAGVEVVFREGDDEFLKAGGEERVDLVVAGFVAESKGGEVGKVTVGGIAV
jgi:hypothetical protein